MAKLSGAETILDLGLFLLVVMPKLSGLQTAVVIRNMERINNISRPVAIIGTTTDLNNVTHAEFIEAGANAALEKPVAKGEMEVLITAIMPDNNN